MKVRLLVDVRYPAPWVDTPELADDPYGVLLYPGDYELLNTD